jgi:hypothetical protein
MDNSKEDSAAIEKLYEYGEHLSESSDKSKVSLAQTFLRPPKKKCGVGIVCCDICNF